MRILEHVLFREELSLNIVLRYHFSEKPIIIINNFTYRFFIKYKFFLPIRLMVFHLSLSVQISILNYVSFFKNLQLKQN